MVKRVDECLERILSEMCTITKKEPIPAADLENMSKLADAFKDLTTSKGMLEYGKDSSDGRWNGMPVTSYDEYPSSARRGRSPMTGRYVSRDSGYNEGYSGHSIVDRMIDNLERMMDQAQSDYERNEIKAEIDNLRRKEMR